MNELQTSANTAEKSEDTKRYEAGHGGSYTVDPVTGEAVLNECTQEPGKRVKHPDAPQHFPAAEAAEEAAPATVAGAAGSDTVEGAGE